jgi:hypothetical protein
MASSNATPGLQPAVSSVADTFLLHPRWICARPFSAMLLHKSNGLTREEVTNRYRSVCRVLCLPMVRSRADNFDLHKLLSVRPFLEVIQNGDEDDSSERRFPSLRRYHCDRFQRHPQFLLRWLEPPWSVLQYLVRPGSYALSCVAPARASGVGLRRECLSDCWGESQADRRTCHSIRQLVAEITTIPTIAVSSAIPLPHRKPAVQPLAVLLQNFWRRRIIRRCGSACWRAAQKEGKTQAGRGGWRHGEHRS